MRTLLILSLCLVAFCVSEDVPEGNVELAELKSLGDKALADNKLDDAIKYYTSAIKIDPYDVTFNYKRAAAYLLKGKNFNALEDLNIVLQNKPSFLQARLRRGKVFVALGKFSLAKQDFREVLEDKPDNDIAKKQLELIIKCEDLLERGQSAFDNANYELALSLFNTFLEDVPESVNVRILRAKCNLYSKHYNLVIEDTMKVLKIMSNHIEALYLRGKAFYYLGQIEATLNHYREGLKSDPDNSYIKEDYKILKLLDKNMKEGETLYRGGKFTEALSEISSAISIETKNQNTYFLPKLYTMQCDCYLKLRQPKLAIDACTNALQLESSVEALCNRAEAHIQLEDYDAAMGDYQQANQQEQGNHRVREGLHKVQRLQKMAQRKDYYKILGVPKDATPNEIKKAYRKLALEYHPDKHEDQDYAETKMQEINEAVEVLSNEEKRRRYDSGEDIQDMNQPGGHGFHHQGFPFGSQFGGGGFHFNFNFG